jgi:hypothetical protein
VPYEKKEAVFHFLHRFHLAILCLFPASRCPINNNHKGTSLIVGIVKMAYRFKELSL